MTEGESRVNVPTGCQTQSYRRHDVLKLPYELLEEISISHKYASIDRPVGHIPEVVITHGVLYLLAWELYPLRYAQS